MSCHSSSRSCPSSSSSLALLLLVAQYLAVQLPERCCRSFSDFVVPDVQNYGIAGADRGTDAAADAPFTVDYRDAVRHLHGINRAYRCAFPASRACFRVGFPHEISGHDRVPGDFSPADVTHIPTRAAAAVTVVLDFPFSVVHEMHQAGLFRHADQVKGFPLGQFPGQARDRLRNPPIRRISCRLPWGGRTLCQPDGKRRDTGNGRPQYGAHWR